MTKSVPQKIEVPKLSDLPYIRAKYERLLSIKQIQHDDDHDFSHNFFYNPASVAYEQVTALEMLSEETFAALCREMQPAFYGNPFRDKSSLESITLTEFEAMNEFEEDDGHAVFEQVMSYIDFKSRACDKVRWDRIAELYNNSQESQQRALVSYFDKCRNRDLLDILSTRAPAIEVPEALNESFDTKIEQGDTHFFDPEQQRWIREDLFENQFEVYGHPSGGGISLLGTAPTLKIALFKAISLTRDEKEHSFMSVSIEHGRYNLVAEGKVVLGNGSTRCQMINWPSLRGSKGESFNKALYAVEKSLGLHWSKVRRLEDELGL